MVQLYPPNVLKEVGKYLSKNPSSYQELTNKLKKDETLCCLFRVEGPGFRPPTACHLYSAEEMHRVLDHIKKLTDEYPHSYIDYVIFYAMKTSYVNEHKANTLWND